MEEIARRRPVDITAARVTSSGPKGYESQKEILTVCQAEPPLMRPYPPGVPSLNGRQSGYLTVIGLSMNKSKGKFNTSRYVCRCSCGYYTERTSKSIRGGVNRPIGAADADKCDRCRQVAYLRHRSTFDQLGYNPEEFGRKSE